MTESKNTIAKIVTWAVRIGSMIYLGNSAIQGELGSIDTMITGGVWGTVEITNAILFVLKVFIPFKTVDTALQSIKASIPEDTYKGIVKFVVNNIPQLSDLLDKQGGEITTIFSILKANALISYSNGIYNENEEAKQIIEAVINN